VRRVPLGLRWAAAGIAAAAAAAVVVGGPTSTPGPRAEPVTERVAQLGDQDVAMVLLTARSVRPLDDYIRSSSPPGACTLVPIGTSPQRAVAAALHRALPAYRVRDVGRTLNQDTAMCVLTLRARDASGSVLVLQIVAPPRVPRAATTRVNVGPDAQHTTATVATVRATTAGGWSVVLGTVGPDTARPAAAALLRLALDPALRW
jgi:hypothetical protein